MTRLIQALHALALVLVCAGLWQARYVPKHLDGVLTRAEAVEGKINASAVNMDHATAAWAGAASAQAASINALVRQAQGTLGTVNVQLEHVAPLFDQARVTIAGAGQDIHALTVSGQQVAENANQTIAAVQPVVQHIDATVTSISPDLQRMIHASADTTEHVDGISASTDKMAAHIEHDFDAKKPWWKKALPVMTDSAKLAECFTRGNCF